MAWRRRDDKPLSESMTIILLTHICVTRPQWVQIFLIQWWAMFGPAFVGNPSLKVQCYRFFKVGILMFSNHRQGPCRKECTRSLEYSWWRHQIETFSALLAICAGNSPVPGEYPAQRPVTRSFDVFFDLRLNKQLSRQSGGWWFEMLPRPLRRHSNVMVLDVTVIAFDYLDPLLTFSVDDYIC